MNRLSLPVFLRFLCCLLFTIAAATGQDKPADNPLNEPLGDHGVIPVGLDGKPLNLNFESGNLDGWKAEGEAFAGQPIKGDIADLRPADRKKSEHTGQYWIGGYEKAKDLPQGTLTSPIFEATHPYASFLIGGGSSRQTRVDIIDVETNRAFYGAAGQNQENLRPVIVDLQPIKGKKIFLRITDQASGGWGHINFDDFRFHSTRPRFKSLAGELPQPEATALYPNAGLSPQEAAKAMVVPPGFSVQVAAAEPDVQQPVAMAIDDRGRIWIAEAKTYPRRAKDGEGKDRILIFEDTDLNGTLDKRTIFCEGLNLVSGLEVGFGGVWVGAAPYLLFIPDHNQDDQPDGVPMKSEPLPGLAFPKDVPANGTKVLLDGWGYEDTHETLNSFIWGPDGWLYGCHGVFTHSKVGKPGTPDDKRVRINAGVWRYHPVRHEFEVFAHGTSNPWGLDYDQYGNFFATACVIPHLFHIIPGARYERQGGQHFNPYTYDDIKTIADHRHYTGNQWNDGNRLQSDTLGGGHAHAGCMIYQGGAWPEKYRGQLFMNNIHGNRMNVDILEASGSGFVGHHGQDFLLTRDQWSQMLYMTYGPDGQVWVIDWYDRNQCHRPDPTVHDKSNGRIYRIVYDNAKPVKVDLQKLSDEELVKLLKHKNEWYVRHAQRILQERGSRLTVKESKQAFVDALIDNVFKKSANEEEMTRAHWTLGAVRDCMSPAPTAKGIINAGPLFGKFPRFIAVKTAYELKTIENGELDSSSEKELIDLATSNPHLNRPVRLAIASNLYRLKPEFRWRLLEALTSHSEDANDHNLPLMYWYAMEPLADVDPPRALALALALGEGFRTLREYMIRRIGSGDPEKSLELLMTGLAKTGKQPWLHLSYLRGISEALKGRRRVNPPPSWAEVFKRFEKSGTDENHFLAMSIGVTFGEPTAAEAIVTLVQDKTTNVTIRRRALQFLASDQDPNVVKLAISLLNDTNFRVDALRALAALNDDRVPSAILAVYPDLSPAERQAALATLCSRPAYANALMGAIAAGKIPANHLTADLVTNLRNLSDEALNKRIEHLWGIVRSSPEEKKQLIEHYKRLLTQTRSVSEGNTPTRRASEGVSVELGRAVFAKTCQQCHTLFGTGSKVGPDITGSQRANLDYLLSNVLDPSAVMAKEYQPTVVRTTDGRVITGILKEETAAAISLQTQNELVVISKADIDESKLSDKSMMPDDLLKPLTDREVRSLVAYLAAPGQTPMLATTDNVTSFYNGKDLAGWIGDDHLWSVENGEIVGKTPGLKKNEFLMSELSLGDFRLELDVKLIGDKGNSGIQIRSERIENGLMRGYQCDIGPGWWGKLYEEHGRALLESKGGEQFVKKGDWNHYEIVAVGSRVRTWINGNLCVDRDDPIASKRGLLGLQLHSGGETEVRYKNLKLTLIPSAVPARPYPASKAVSLLGAGPALGAGLPTPPSPKISFKKTTLDRAFRSEGVGMGDFNNDGLLDISAGSVWYEQPPPLPLREGRGEGAWKMHVLGEKANSFDIKTYGDTFMNWAEDVDHDGRLDLIVVDFPGKPTWWFQNPGTREGEAPAEPKAAISTRPVSEGPWKKHAIVPVTNNESPQYLDGDGDGQRGLVFGDASKRLTIARPQSNPLVEWKTTHVSAPGDVNMVNFYHGLGIGDINKDGINDILVPNGWWQGATEPTTDPWTFHPAPFGQPQAQMYVYDFDADGDNDVIGSSAHRRGIWWYEQNGKEWKTHLIDESIAQTHALVLADINGDGLPDLVTGKRYYAHNGRDPGEDEPPELAWFELSRGAGVSPAKSTPTWTKHLIDNDSGVGTQFEVHDMNSDGLLDIIIANKHGVYYFEQERGAGLRPAQ